MANSNPNQKLGKAVITFGSKRLITAPGAKLDVGGIARKTVLGSTAVAGFTEEPKQSRLECSVIIGRGDSVKELNSDDISFVFEADTGQVYSVKNGWVVDTQTIDSGTGQVQVVIEGYEAQEVV